MKFRNMDEERIAATVARVYKEVFDEMIERKLKGEKFGKPNSKKETLRTKIGANRRGKKSQKTT